jgi:hypothetical protein
VVLTGGRIAASSGLQVDADHLLMFDSAVKGAHYDPGQIAKSTEMLIFRPPITSLDTYLGFVGATTMNIGGRLGSVVPAHSATSRRRLGCLCQLRHHAVGGTGAPEDDVEYDKHRSPFTRTACSCASCYCSK